MRDEPLSLALTVPQQSYFTSLAEHSLESQGVESDKCGKIQDREVSVAKKKKKIKS